MGCVSLFFDSVRYQVVALWLELTVAVTLHFLGGVVKHSSIALSPLHDCVSFGSEAGYLLLAQLILTEHNLFSLQEIAAVRPCEQAGIVKATILEKSAVDLRVRPDLEVSVIWTLVILALMVSFLPLIHLNLTLKTVTILSHHTEVLVTQIRVVVSRALDVHQFAFVLFTWTVSVD